MRIQLENGKTYRSKLGETMTLKLVAPGADFAYGGVEEPPLFMATGCYLPESGRAVCDLNLVGQVH